MPSPAPSRAASRVTATISSNAFGKPMLGRELVVDRESGHARAAHQLAQHRIPRGQATLHEAAAMGVDQQRRPLGIVGQVEAARHLAVRTRQREIALTLERHRAFAEKCADPVLRGAHLGERRLSAVGGNQAVALQQGPGRQQLRIDPRCRVVHRSLSRPKRSGRFNPPSAASQPRSLSARPGHDPSERVANERMASDCSHGLVISWCNHSHDARTMDDGPSHHSHTLGTTWVIERLKMPRTSATQSRATS